MEKHIPFLMADLQISIPSMVDGLKRGQRKILFYAFKKPILEQVIVAEFGSHVLNRFPYHDSWKSIVSTIIGMAHDFVGSNNINLLYPRGQFGSRLMGGKDHGKAEHIYTRLSPLTRNLFHEADELLLDYLNEDGQSLEPKWFIPIIPMILVNGSKGQPTSFVPNYNPRDIIANLKRLLHGEAVVPMEPWYKGFKGTIQKMTSKENRYITTGLVEVNNDHENLVRIIELPIRRWVDDYTEFLRKQPFVEKVKHYSSDVTVDYEVIMTADQMSKARQEGLLKKFKLITTLSTSNMYLLDANGVIKNFEDFFHLRLDYYVKRKVVMLRKLRNELLKLSNKVRFIREFMEGTVTEDTDLRRKGYTPFPEEGLSRETEYDYLHMTFETMMEQEPLLARKTQELNDLKYTDPKSLWLRDLDALNKQLDDQDKKAAEDETWGNKLLAEGFWRPVTETIAEDSDYMDDEVEEDEATEDSDFMDDKEEEEACWDIGVEDDEDSSG